MTATNVGSGSRLDIGKVLQDTFSVMKRNLKPFFLAGLLMVALPAVLQVLIRAALRPTGVFTPPLIGLALVGLVLGVIFQAGLMYAAVQDLNGGPATIGEFLTIGAKAFLPLIGLGLLAGVAIDIGFIFLIVPGVLLILRWSIAAPVLICEGRGILGSMGRSAALTKGRRGAILLLFLMIFIILLVIDGVFFGLMGGMTSLGRPQNYVPSLTPLALSGMIIAPLISIVFSAFFAVMMAALFHHLRATREGGTAESLAQVFA